MKDVSLSFTLNDKETSFIYLLIQNEGCLFVIQSEGLTFIE